MKPIETLRGYKPLLIDGENTLILSKGNKVFKRDSDASLEFIFEIPDVFWRKFLSRFNVFSRLLRLGFGCAAVFKDSYFFIYLGNIYSYEIATGKLTKELEIPNGRGPLTFSVIEGIEGIDDGIYFGEYFGNEASKPVSIYKRNKNGSWSVVYTFAQGLINHIHNIVADPYRGCLWILAGDFEDSAGVWQVKNNFTDVNVILSGEQIYRSCVAFPLESGLLYATDSQFIKNSIRILKESDGIWSSESISDLNGSCIYGVELRDYYVFSTATEPGNEVKGKLRSLLDTKPGPGIINNRSDVVLVSKKELEVTIAFSNKKDIFPYRLFQFGAIMFPFGKSIDNDLISYSVSNRDDDLSTVIYSLDRKELKN